MVFSDSFLTRLLSFIISIFLTHGYFFLDSFYILFKSKEGMAGCPRTEIRKRKGKQIEKERKKKKTKKCNFIVNIEESVR